jgi:light-regulated signal transduction histidine kinase (bacteriophytochrome)
MKFGKCSVKQPLMPQNNPPIDLSDCEREAIHLTGRIQPHGALLAIDLADRTVCHVSANLEEITGITAAGSLGQPWSGIAYELGLDLHPGDLPPGPGGIRIPCNLAGRSLILHAHRTGGERAVLEWEILPDAPGGESARALTLSALEMEQANVYRGAQELAEVFREATGYDRIMVYRFHPDWSGEVIAESREADLLPFMGLRYPASDIPPQARELYLRNRLRMIVDVQAVNPVIEAADPETHLDLSFSELRSVSPYHLEYLDNMGVRATIACSLIADGRLWGLVVGHHYQRRHCPPAVRQAAGSLAEQFSGWLEATLHAEQAEQARLCAQEQENLRRALGRESLPRQLRSLLIGNLSIPRIFGADGAAFVAGSEVVTVGTAPPAEWMLWLVQRLGREDQLPDEPGLCCAMEQLPEGVEPPLSGSEKICGILGAVLIPGPDPVLLFAFRQETVQTIEWGGDPATPALVDQEQRIRPRKSFARWQETLTNRAEPWSGRLRDRMTLLATFLAQSHAPDQLRQGLESVLSDVFHERQAFFGIASAALVQDPDQINLLLSESTAPERTFSISNSSNGFNRLFGFDPVIPGQNSLAALLRQTGLDPDVLVQQSGPLEFWSHQGGRRILKWQWNAVMSIHCRQGSRRWWQVAFTDLTARERSTEAMTVARDQARHAQEQQAALLANMSHEMRTPLNAVLGYSELISLDETTDFAEIRKYSQTIHRAGQHLLDLISDSLDLASVESGTITLDEADIDPSELIHEVVDWMSELARRKAIEVLVEAPETVSLRADRQRLRQILINLLSNAIKYTPENGQVRIGLTLRPGEGAVLFVRDTGIGIPTEKIDRIFDRFQRLDDGQVRKMEGTGLGLAITKALVQRHGGSISVHSREGQGTTFEVCMPEWRLMQKPVEEA